MTYNTVFVSDVHLGTERCNHEKFLSFLRKLDTKKLVLVGDIIDITGMEKHGGWKKQHTNCVNELINLLRDGTEIVYICGNHEGKLRKQFDYKHKRLTICDEYVHKDSKGEKYLCIHGDKCSQFSSGSWKQLVFNWGYQLITPIDFWTCKLFKFSLIYYLKNTVNGKKYIEKYESDVAKYCKMKGKYKGVICGHIHHADMKAFGDVVYMCCGDWVDTCSAIVETKGTYEIKKYK